MSHLLIIILGFAVSAGVTTALNLISDEVRARLDAVPFGLLAMASKLLRGERGIECYRNEWLPELHHILRESEMRPITRFVIGLRFSLSLLGRALVRPQLFYPGPDVLIAEPRNPELLAAVAKWAVSNKSHGRYYKLLMRVPIIGVTMGSVRVPRKAWLACREECNVIFIIHGSSAFGPMKLDEFDSIASELERMAHPGGQ